MPETGGIFADILVDPSRNTQKIPDCPPGGRIGGQNIPDVECVSETAVFLCHIERMVSEWY
jgi:hypothetical protein